MFSSVRVEHIRSMWNKSFHFQVLRFSRLFKPVYSPHIWKKKKKKKPEETDKKDEQTNKHKKEIDKEIKSDVQEDIKSETKVEKEEDEMDVEVTETSTAVLNGAMDVKEEIKSEPEDNESSDEEDYRKYCPFDLDMGRPAKPEEIATNDLVSGLIYLSATTLCLIFLQDSTYSETRS